MYSTNFPFGVRNHAKVLFSAWISGVMDDNSSLMLVKAPTKLKT